VARLGGDEFAIIAEDLTHPDAAGTLAEKLIQVLSQGMHIDQHEVAASASIGISIYPDDAGDSEELIRTADTALYHAKDEGRNAFRFYRTELSIQTSKRMAMENMLRQALSREHFVLHYQPLIDLTTGRCIAVEALLRCHSPELGLVMPDAFIPLAEETRLIQPIGMWVLRQALRDLAIWRAQGVDLARLAVNVSWHQFKDQEFSQQLRLALEAHGLKAGDIEFDLEITESALQSNPQSVADLLELRDLGVRVIIDDFGIGYSSLSQLMNLRVDGLKLDRSFLQDIDRDPSSRAVIRAIIALGRSLGLSVVGEGVERLEQLQLLCEEGCHMAQGFLFSRPVPAEQIPALLKTLLIDATPFRPGLA
jgi:predicted signal transduction protein with EAL and GGDEF domain